MNGPLRTLALGLLALPLLAATPSKEAGFLGAGIGADGTTRWDLGFNLGQAGLESWGLDLGYVSRDTPQDDLQPYAAAPPGTSSRIVAFGGWQAGGYVDLGRAWFGLGVENLDDQTQALTIHPDHSTSAGAALQKGGTGAFLKVGWKVGRISLYGTYGTRTGAAIGLALHL